MTSQLPTILVPRSHNSLTTPAVPFVFGQGTDAEEIVNHMLTVMSNENGIGLAANQLGLPWNIFVIHGEPFACINPRIVDQSTEEVELDEGCLTLPKYTIKIKRPKSIKLRWSTIKGDTETQTFTGMTARIIQHEMDHLKGVWFYTRASKFHRDQAERKQLNRLKLGAKPERKRVDGQSIWR